MSIKLNYKKGDPIVISGIYEPPVYEKDERWLKLNDELLDAESIEEVNRILRNMNVIERSYCKK